MTSGTPVLVKGSGFYSAKYRIRNYKRGSAMIKIFEGYADASEILESVLSNGVAGISGGRLEVREKMSEVGDLAGQEGHESVVT